MSDGRRYEGEYEIGFGMGKASCILILGKLFGKDGNPKKLLRYTKNLIRT